MKKINKSLLTIGAFACLSACYGVANAATVNLNVQKSDNSGYSDAIVSIQRSGAASFSLAGKTNANGQLTFGLGNYTGSLVVRIMAGNSLIYDTLNVQNVNEVLNLNKSSVLKVIEYTNSADQPYANKVIGVRNPISWSSVVLNTNNEGYANFEMFENSTFLIETVLNNQSFSQEFNSNLADTFKIHTVAANIHWPHSLSHSGNTGTSYDLSGNSPIKTIEVLPSTVKMRFTAESISGPVTSEYSLPIPYDANNKQFDYTPVQFRVHKADGTLATEAFPLTHNFINETPNSITSNLNGTAMVVLEGNVTNKRITGNAYKFGKKQDDLSSALTIAGKNNLLDFRLAKLTFNTIATGDAKMINYKLPGTSSYVTFVQEETNTPIDIDLFPNTYNFQAEYQGTVKNLFPLAVQTGNNDHTFGLDKVTVRYEDSNTNPLADGVISRVAGSVIRLGTTDASGEVGYYRFITGTINEGLRLNDVSRGFNINHQYARLIEGQDNVAIIVNPNVSVPVSGMLALNSNVNVYPNPATDFIQVKMDAAQGEVYIYNTVGQLVYNNTNVANNETISVSALSTGVYNVVIVANDKKETVRIIKN